MDHLTVRICIATCAVICAIFGILLKFRFWRGRLSEQASKFPGPPTLPLIGNAHLFTGGTEAILDKVLQLSKLYPTPYRVWLGNYLIFVLNTPEQVKVVMHSPKTVDKGIFYDFMQPWLGTGLLSATGAKCRIHRKLMQPAFSSTVLQSFIGTFTTRSAIMVEEMKRNLDGPEFDTHNYTSQFTLHSICETTMGVDLQKDGNNCYAKALEKAAHCLCRRIVSPWLHPNFIFHRTQCGKEQTKHVKYLHNFADNVIRTKKQSLEHTRVGFQEGTGDQIPRKKILLDHLMEAVHNGEQFSDQELREEVDTIIATGSDTTAIMSSYAMLMLASHPEIQETVYQEICRLYGEDDGKELNFTPENLASMTYLERVVKETIRLFPIAPFMVRAVTGDLDMDEHTFPDGSLVVISVMGLHRNGDYWPDPLNFDPDRFLPEIVKGRHKYAYLPFSGGLRACLGSKYAMMSMKILLATTLRKYVLKKDTIIPVRDFRVKWQIVLAPVDPVTLRIESRTPQVPSL